MFENMPHMTKTPEQWLEDAEPTRKRGLFKLFLGYAPGVGKTTIFCATLRPSMSTL
jgi:two-component system, OmpR family, sensor histidine kinase KdpD